jgi:hypothetical protein
MLLPPNIAQSPDDMACLHLLRETLVLGSFNIPATHIFRGGGMGLCLASDPNESIDVHLVETL